jgi:hypothetical protein
MKFTTVQYSIVIGETTRADEIQPQRITTALNVLVQQCFIPKLALINCFHIGIICELLLCCATDSYQLILINLAKSNYRSDVMSF